MKLNLTTINEKIKELRWIKFSLLINFPPPLIPPPKGDTLRISILHIPLFEGAGGGNDRNENTTFRFNFAVFPFRHTS